MTQKNLFPTKIKTKKMIIMMKFPRKDMKRLFARNITKIMLKRVLLLLPAN